MVADTNSGKSREVVWEYRGVCRVPVTAEFMASAHQKTLLYGAGGLEQGISCCPANPACKLGLHWTTQPAVPNPTLGAPSSLQPLSRSQKG